MEAHPAVPLYLSGGSDGAVALWAFEREASLASFKRLPLPGVRGAGNTNGGAGGHSAAINRIRFNASGDVFGACDSAGQVWLWQLHSDEHCLSSFEHLMVRALPLRPRALPFGRRVRLRALTGPRLPAGTPAAGDGLCVPERCIMLCHRRRSGRGGGLRGRARRMRVGYALAALPRAGGQRGLPRGCVRACLQPRLLLLLLLLALAGHCAALTPLPLYPHASAGGATSLAYSPRHCALVSAGVKGDLACFDLRMWRPLCEAPAAGRTPVCTLALDPVAGAFVVAANVRGDVQVRGCRAIVRVHADGRRGA